MADQLTSPQASSGALAVESPFRRVAADFCESKLAVAGLVVLILLCLTAILAPVISPQDPHDQAQLNLMDGELPPGSVGLQGMHYYLGTDGKGCDMLSAILCGLLISLGIGVMSGLVASQWVYFARAVRGAGIANSKMEYIAAARCLALSTPRVLFKHLLPNCLPPLIVVCTVQVGNAIALEATLSFLGVGLPVTKPSLGFLIANGYQYMLSDMLWISFSPGIALLNTIVSINLVADQLREALNPRSQE